MSKPIVECPFCSVQAPILVNELAFVVMDKYPVNPGHVLILPKRHVASLFDLSSEEGTALAALMTEVRLQTDATFGPDGYNVGVNVGEAAGQTVMHVHIHLIPRYRGDTANPRGGVRGVIPSRQSYPVA